MVPVDAITAGKVDRGEVNDGACESSASEDGQQCTLVVLVESLGLAWHRIASQSRCFARRPRPNAYTSSSSQHYQRRRRHRRLTVDEQLILCQHHDRHHSFSRRRAQRLHTVLSPIFTAHHFTCGSPNESGASTSSVYSLRTRTNCASWASLLLPSFCFT